MSQTLVEAPVPLRIENLTVSYPNGKTAVRDLSLEVRPGEVFGLVGPNGAGKSTLLKAAAGLIAPQSGAVYYGSVQNKGNGALGGRHVAFMPDPLGVYNDLKSREYLEFFARAFEHGHPHATAADRAKRIGGVVERLGLGPWLNHEVESLSAGWQRRLSLGRILLADAPIVLLDEPAAGLDVTARRELLDVVRGLASETRAILITSHILPELQELADRFGVIGNGSWAPVAGGQTFFTSDDLKQGFGTARGRLACSEPARAREALLPLHADAALTTEGDGLLFNAADREAMAKAIAHLTGAGIKIYEARIESRSLSEVAAQVLKPAA